LLLCYSEHKPGKKERKRKKAKKERDDKIEKKSADLIVREKEKKKEEVEEVVTFLGVEFAFNSERWRCKNACNSVVTCDL